MKKNQTSIDPSYTSDRFDAKWQGNEITIWNHVTVEQTHQLAYGLKDCHYQVLAGDGSTLEEPRFITPYINKKLESIDIFADIEVVDPSADDVTLL